MSSSNITKMKAKAYCIAFGCLNNNKDSTLTFFTLPKDIERRRQWLTLIDREDLLKRENLKRSSHLVCSAHFEDSSIKIIKHLKETALPSIREESSLSEKEIKVFCPKCDTEVSHTGAGIQEDQTKILIAKVYHYFEQEFEELKTIYGDLDLTPLSKFRQRTALATGVCETTILQILKEEEGRNADKRQEQEPPEKPCRARKRSRQTGSSSEEDSSDDNADGNEQSSDVHDEEPEIYVLKVETSDVEFTKEQAHTDPISLNVKREPRSDVVDNANETLALNEPAGTKCRARKIPRSDVTSTRQHTQGESSTAAASSSVRVTEDLDESSLLGDTEIKAEEIDIHEEGVS